MYQVIGLGFDGCQASGLTSPFDVFNVINTLWKQQRCDTAPLYECHLVSLSGESVHCSNGMKLHADFSCSEVAKADLIILPGIHHTDGRNLLDSLSRLKAERQWLEAQAQQGVTIAANCSGVFMLAEAGLLNDQTATTAWWLGSMFSKRYPQVEFCPQTLLVKNKQFYTTGSMTANLGVMLQIAEEQVGRQITQAAARTMLIDASQSYASPYLFMQNQSDHQDSLVLAVESQLQRDISQRLDLNTLAKQHAVSVRTLSRRFKQANGVNLSEYLQSLRMEQTKLLLETTNLSLEKIAERVGYGSQSSLRRLFQKNLGLSPKQYRLDRARHSRTPLRVC